MYGVTSLNLRMCMLMPFSLKYTSVIFQTERSMHSSTIKGMLTPSQITYDNGP